MERTEVAGGSLQVSDQPTLLEMLLLGMAGGAVRLMLAWREGQLRGAWRRRIAQDAVGGGAVGLGGGLLALALDRNRATCLLFALAFGIGWVEGARKVQGKVAELVGNSMARMAPNEKEKEE